MLITPTGMGADELRAQDMVWVGFDGSMHGDWQPSSEWHFHQAVYARRADVQAVVHTHSVNATALACLRRELPAFHYMVAVAGGDSVPCTAYHIFGSEALSQAVAQALEARNACLMAHHGLVAAGATLAQAMTIAIEDRGAVRGLPEAAGRGRAGAAGPAQMAEVLDKFRRYGRARRS